MSVSRLQIDWPELEPSPKTYDQDNFEKRLMEMEAQGLQPFLLISAYDSDGPVVPDDVEEKDFDDPELIQRFKSLMDWVIPLLIDQFSESLETIELIHYNNGTPKKAWGEFLFWLTEL